MCVTHAFSVDSNELLQQEWEVFKLQHNKNYEESEDEKRLQIFIKNKIYIAKHNQLYEKGERSYSLEMNRFGDWTDEEIDERLYGYYDIKRHFKKTKGTPYTPPANYRPPSRMDWRRLGAVTAVQDQTPCGCCWAFSAIGALEGQLYQAQDRLVKLSEQQLVDCADEHYGNFGCRGGSPANAFDYTVEFGVETARKYQYISQQKKCDYKKKFVAVKASDYLLISPTEDNLMKTVGKFGPVSVVLDGRNADFLFYKHGVYYNPLCRNKSGLNHAALVVGYGALEVEGDYWLIKNSFGTDWGYEGYMLLARNRENNCGVATNATLPVVGARVDFIKSKY
ncbi:cathepsin L1-like [Hyposmocoma kahamanoa]|uniref:cathepsin L1-like n=1 Tax=Hyposmocoma kahamanoa TaxID=1477025 RepID=UPI000E6D9F20|nr:cathepsin L1-like [Hyposmocoma kahamanoa]